MSALLAHGRRRSDRLDCRTDLVIERLQATKAEIIASDPVAVEPMRERFLDIAYADSVAVALEGADGAVVVTDWDTFATLNEESNAMATPIVVDGRRSVEPPKTSSTKAKSDRRLRIIARADVGSVGLR